MSSAIVPTSVQKTYTPSTAVTGTPMRLVKYTFKGTKAADSDWIVTATYFQTGDPIYYNACTVDSSDDMVQEGTVGMTYDETAGKLVLAGGTSGTTYGEVWYEE